MLRNYSHEILWIYGYNKSGDIIRNLHDESNDPKLLNIFQKNIKTGTCA